MIAIPNMIKSNGDKQHPYATSAVNEPHVNKQNVYIYCSHDSIISSSSFLICNWDEEFSCIYLAHDITYMLSLFHAFDYIVIICLSFEQLDNFSNMESFI